MLDWILPSIRWRPGVFLHQNREAILDLHVRQGVPAVDIHQEIVQCLQAEAPYAKLSIASLRRTLARWRKELAAAPEKGRPAVPTSHKTATPVTGAAALARIGRTLDAAARKKLLG